MYSHLRTAIPSQMQNKVIEDVEDGDPHSGGEIWATIMYEVYWNFVDAYGFGKLREVKDGKGNTKFVRFYFTF